MTSGKSFFGRLKKNAKTVANNSITNSPVALRNSYTTGAKKPEFDPN